MKKAMEKNGESPQTVAKLDLHPKCCIVGSTTEVCCIIRFLKLEKLNADKQYEIK